MLLIRDRDRGGGKRAREWRLDRAYRPKKTEETVDRHQNNGSNATPDMADLRPGRNATPDMADLRPGGNAIPDMANLRPGRNATPDMADLRPGRNATPDMADLRPGRNASWYLVLQWSWCQAKTTDGDVDIQCLILCLKRTKKSASSNPTRLIAATVRLTPENPRKLYWWQKLVTVCSFLWCSAWILCQCFSPVTKTRTHKWLLDC